MAWSWDSGRGQAAERWLPVGGAFRAESGSSSHLCPHGALIRFLKLSALVVCLSLTLTPHARAQLLRRMKGSGAPPSRSSSVRVGVRKW